MMTKNKRNKMMTNNKLGKYFKWKHKNPNGKNRTKWKNKNMWKKKTHHKQNIKQKRFSLQS
jgi:hypothetical protein